MPLKTKHKKAAPPAAVKDPAIVATSTLLEVLQITQTTLHRWQSDPSFPSEAKVGHGLFDLRKVVPWRIEKLTGGDELATEFNQSKLRLQKARAEREEMDVQERRCALIPKDKVISDLSLLLGNLKTRILSWSRGLPGKLAHREEREIMEIIGDEAHFILTELSQGFERRFNGKTGEGKKK